MLTRRGGQPVFQIEATSDGLIVVMPAWISSAPSAGMAISDTTPGKIRIMPAIQTPVKIAAMRVLGPAITLSAVELNDPPTGRPRKKPAARLPTPCAMKSRDTLVREPSG